MVITAPVHDQHTLATLSLAPAIHNLTSVLASFGANGTNDHNAQVLVDVDGLERACADVLQAAAVPRTDQQGGTTHHAGELWEHACAIWVRACGLQDHE